MSTEVFIMNAAELGDGNLFRITRYKEGASTLAIGCVEPEASDLYVVEASGFSGKPTTTHRKDKVLSKWRGGIPLDYLRDTLSSGLVETLLLAQCAKVKIGGEISHIPAASITQDWVAQRIED